MGTSDEKYSPRTSSPGSVPFDVVSENLPTNTNGKGHRGSTRRSGELSLSLDDYADLLHLSSSRISCFAFEDPLPIDLDPDALIRAFWDSEAYCVFANLSFLRTFNDHAQSDPLGSPLRDFFPYHEERNRRVVEEFAASGCSLQNFEYPYSIREERSGLLLVSLYPIIENRLLTKLWIVHRELIESNAAIERLRLAEEHYRTLVERPGLILSRIRPNGHYQYVSPTVVECVGRTPEDFYSHPKLWLEFVHPDDREAYDTFDRARNIQSMKPVELEYRVRGTDGAYRWYLERQTPRLAESGELLYFDCVTMSIQEKKTLENELIQAERMKTMGRLAAGIAHEFNNHLTAIIGQLGMLLEELPNDAPEYSQLASAEQSALLCGEIARQLISFGSGVDGERRPLDLGKLIASTNDFLEKLLPDNVVVDIELVEELPKIRGNSAYLQQILIMLAKRAGKSMPHGGRVKIALRRKELPEDRPRYLYPRSFPGEYIEVSVGDTGIAIPEEDLKHIFEPRFSKPQNGSSGSVESLCMVYSVVESHGGSLFIRSKERLGTTVGMIFPMLEEEPPSEELKEKRSQRKHKQKYHSISASLAGRKVLVAEDDEMVLSMVEAALSMSGLSVITAVDGEAAVKLFRKHKDDIGLALIDHTMPKLSGREVLHIVRHEAPDLPVILTSGYGHALPLVQELEDDQKTSFLSKPFPIPTLIREVQSKLQEQIERVSAV